MNRFRSIGRCDAASVAAVALAFLAALAGIAALVPAVDGQDMGTPTPIGVIESAENLVECPPTEVGAAPPGVLAAAAYAIVSEESAARYRVKEELATVGATEAVGETNAIIGQILFGDDGLPLACSRFDVDLRTLQSDEARRDNYLYDNTLETTTYPLATFVLRTVEGLDGPLAEREEATFTLIGDLTLHGVTKLVAWEATATREGERLTGSAATTFQMPDFDIEPPRVRVVVSLEETVRLEVDLTAERAA